MTFGLSVVKVLVSSSELRRENGVNPPFEQF